MSAIGLSTAAAAALKARQKFSAKIDFFKRLQSVMP
jgi:hypothetical protein